MIGGRYSLDREIGRGGAGAVWLGRDEVLGREVAVKRVGTAPGGADPDLVRAEREARIAARVNHPHVVAIFDLVQDDDAQWLVMEYVDGRTLADIVRDRGPLTPDVAAIVLVQVAEALAAAHEAGVVHRDVKPSNILVTADGRAKLSDFGIARAEADASLTQTGMVTGSPAYLAPEVASGQQATAASDVWSLGATLFHTLAGRPPYEVGGNVLGALYRIVHEEPPRLSDAGWLAPFLESSMTHDPARRWPMARVAEFLRAGPSAEPPVERTEVLTAVPPQPEQRPASTPAAPARPRRRVGVLPWLVGAAVVALVVMIGLIVYYGTRDSPEAPEADRTPPTPPSDTGSESSSPPAADEAEMEQFAEDYVATAASDPDAGFAMLTPEYQAASGGLEGYRTFWDTVTNARILDVDADASDPDNLTVTYTYRYNQRGQGSKEETVRLQLVAAADGYLIAGAA